MKKGFYALIVLTLLVDPICSMVMLPGGYAMPKIYTFQDGDILLGALFPVHAFNESSNSPGKCGAIQEQDGIQTLEAMLFALDEINNDPDFLPGFTLGAIALDSCDNEIHAVDQAVEFVKVMVFKLSETVDELPFECSGNDSAPHLKPEAKTLAKISGIIGGSSSAVSIQLARLLRIFKVPQVSYMSTSPDLSNKDRYEYFKRTVPSDTNQAKAIVQLLTEFNYTYVSAIYEDSNYGVKGFAELRKEAEANGICFAVTAVIDFDDSYWNERHYDNLVKQLMSKPKATAVILYADHPQVRELFKAVHRAKLAQRFTWFGSDAWSGRQSVVKGVESIVNGAITTQPVAYTMPNFDEYFFGLNPRNNKRNAWFTEYWQQHFNCKFPNVDPMANTSEKQFPKICTGNEKISKNSGYFQNMNIHFVRDAVYAYAHALKNMHGDLCKGLPGLCPAMTPERIEGEELLKYLGEVKFKDVSKRQFKFMNGSDGPPRYTIRTYRHYETDPDIVPGLSSGWSNVGTHSSVPEDDFTLQLNAPFRRSIGSYPPSFCSQECTKGQVQKDVEGDSCCWICVNCTDYQITVSLGTEHMCIDCEGGTKPNMDQTQCLLIEEEYLKYSNPFSIGACILSIVGCVCVIFVGIVFAIHRKTPVIKAAGLELCYMLLIGIFLSYFVSFVFIAKPTPVSCALKRFFLGFCYTLCYATLLTKTNRISRIFNSQNSGKKTKYISSGSQLFIVGVLVMIECVILGAWLAISVPRTIHKYPTPGDNILLCSGADNASYLIALVYPFILMILCTIYAFKTRKTPDGFSETRLISFTNYTTCIIWLAFITIYFASTYYQVRTFTLCLSVSLSGTVALVCVFAPKVYLCLVRPEKNTKETVMAHRKQSIINPAVPRSSTSGSMNSIDKSPHIPPRKRSSSEGSSNLNISTHSISNLTDTTLMSDGSTASLPAPRARSTPRGTLQRALSVPEPGQQYNNNIITASVVSLHIDQDEHKKTRKHGRVNVRFKLDEDDVRNNKTNDKSMSDEQNDKDGPDGISNIRVDNVTSNENTNTSIDHKGDDHRHDDSSVNNNISRNESDTTSAIDKNLTVDANDTTDTKCADDIVRNDNIGTAKAKDSINTLPPGSNNSAKFSVIVTEGLPEGISV
ncbi:unnamed protein product [Owenia fusiformis]|uniref:Uncharacterized protein n=1 Tax=Owenia fusiformis TaxID=6347 RepID=A0A8J1Y9K7_OWEFU|nr:unnamed protein product [Owenia fusiformis]